MTAQDFPQFPRSLTIVPQSPPHKQTIILLHGRGSNSTEFGPALLFKPIRTHRFDKSSAAYRSFKSTHETITLRQAFPHAKFIFPNATHQPSRAFEGRTMIQWFDDWPLAAMAEYLLRGTSDDPEDKDREWRSELPISGLRRTVKFMHNLTTTEIAILNGDASGVVLGGFSQGSAASLVSTMLWEGESIGAWVGMSGWLPFAKEIIEAATDRNENEDSALQAGVKRLRSILDLPSSSQSPRAALPIENTPLFIMHGHKDKMAPIALGRQVASCLETLELDVQRKEYEDGQHEWSEDMLCDMVEFLWDKIGG